LGQLRLCAAKGGEGKGVATKALETSVEFMPVDEASEPIREMGPTAEVVA
jgi:hypothetical protein